MVLGTGPIAVQGLSQGAGLEADQVVGPGAGPGAHLGETTCAHNAGCHHLKSTCWR